MKISILTLFPEMFDGPFLHSIIKIAQEKELVEIECANIRDFGIGRHHVVDDKPYGGGTGMVLRVDVLAEAITHMKKKSKVTDEKKRKTMLLDAGGVTYTQKKAWDYSTLEHLIVIAGHYEGVDQRIKDHFVDEVISIGDYVLTGGEIPAMVIVDSIVRLIPHVLKDEAPQLESFSLSYNGQTSLLEYPQYTLPRIYQGYSVPDVLLSGNHHDIEIWRGERAVETTKKVRPDLIKKS